MRLIDIDAFRKDWGLAERCEDCERDARECQYDQIYTRMDFCGWLDDAEVIDAVPVVRCKECKYCYFQRNLRLLLCKYRAYSHVVEADEYCSRGERRPDEP